MLKAIVNSPVRSGDQAIIDGNLVIGTAGKGIDFSADPSAPGMTSELLNDYEQGTFTPTVIGTTTAGVGTYSANGQVGKYTKIGNTVFYTIYLDWTDHTGTGSMRVDGLPFGAVGGANTTALANVAALNVTLTANNIPVGWTSGTQVLLYQQPTGTGSIANIAMDTTGQLRISGHYFVS